MQRNIYTKPDLAARIVSELGLSPGMKIADLGCGPGVFLEAIFDRLIGLNHSFSLDDLASHVVGIDIDNGSASRARASLSARYGSPMSGWNVNCADALSLDERESFDVITGNPPWMRVHHLNKATKAFAQASFAVARGAFDLYHLFVEKSVRLLKPGGRLAIVVPQTLRCGPASAPTRSLLDSEGNWKLSPLPADDFVPKAMIKPALLTFQKLRTGEVKSDDQPMIAETLGAVADVTSGVPTGADAVFIVDDPTVEQWRIEKSRLKPVIRGRDIRRAAPETTGQSLIWPYSLDSYGKWQIDDLSDTPNALGYLESHKSRLVARPKLASHIERNPSHWYRVIDQNRHDPHHKIRVVVSDIFRDPAFKIIDNPNVVVHNSCFQIIPRPGAGRFVIEALQSDSFWSALMSSSRLIENNYYRTSVSELKNIPINL